MDEYRIWNNTVSERQAREIAGRLEQGELMVYPTDTLYAMGCDALNVKAVERICRLQGIRPDKVSLSIICKDIAMAAEYARIENRGFRLLRDNTPGPFTFIFREVSKLPRACKGRKEVGVRIPDCGAPLKIAEALGHPILTTSIDAEDCDYMVNPDLIAESYAAKADFILKGDEGGTEPSTVVDCTGPEPEIVRQGKGELK